MIKGWEVLDVEFKTQYMKDVSSRLKSARNSSTVYPSNKELFRAYELCSYKDTNVVIMGQEPYFDGNADGLSFSCKNKISPSLKQIVSAIDKDIGFGKYLGLENDPRLDYLASQGVLLLNTCLTVEENKTSSHNDIGWTNFIVATINALNKKDHVIYMLWGNKAKKADKIINWKHTVLKEEHPVAAARNDRDWKCNHFSKANFDLLVNGKKEIIW